MNSTLKRFTAFLLAFVICLTTFVCADFSTVKADSTKAELENKLANIESEKKQVQANINATKNDINKEAEYQKNIDAQITNTEEYLRTLTDLIAEYNMQIEGLQAQIADRELDIADTEALIEAQQLEIKENIKLYSKRLRAMYLSGNDSVASILLGATDFFDMLMKIELVTRVAGYNNDIIQNLLDLKNALEENKADLESKIAALESDIADVEAEIAEVEALKSDWDKELKQLENLYKESKSHMQQLKNQQYAYEADKKELEKLEEQLEKEIQEIIRKESRKEYLGDLKEGTFLWPVPGFYYISSHYGSRWGTTHRGMDIAGSGISGAEITAANSGEVIFVANNCSHNYGKSSGKWCGCGGGFGNYCIVDHGGGYATLYAHASKITVKKGDKVTTGDVLGYVGSTGNSTGYHLHFEVRVDGERLDPESFNLIKK